MVEHTCKTGCCKRIYLPLTLAYGRTIHKFQGQSAGPVDKGKIKNIYNCIVCDPDTKDWEGRCLGLLYTAVSRGTTLGDADGLNSAVYFQGADFKEDRIRQLYQKKDSGDDYALAVKRTQWVEYLKERQRDMKFNSQAGRKRLEKILDWASSNTVSYQRLSSRVDVYTSSVSGSHQKNPTGAYRKTQKRSNGCKRKKPPTGRPAKKKKRQH